MLEPKAAEGATELLASLLFFCLPTAEPTKLRVNGYLPSALWTEPHWHALNLRTARWNRTIADRMNKLRFFSPEYIEAYHEQKRSDEL
jgi:hypothetical protein